MIDHFCHLMFLMLAGHAYADFALQSPWHSAAKYPANDMAYPWYAALGCHALIHGGIVALITGSWILGVCETIGHAITDYLKGRGWYGSRTDQALHLLQKLVWATAVIYA